MYFLSFPTTETISCYITSWWLWIMNMNSSLWRIQLLLMRKKKKKHWPASNWIKPEQKSGIRPLKSKIVASGVKLGKQECSSQPHTVKIQRRQHFIWFMKRQKAIYHNSIPTASWVTKPDRCPNGCPNLTPVRVHSGGGDGDRSRQWRELQGFMQCYLIDKIYIVLSVENKCSWNICRNSEIL